MNTRPELDRTDTRVIEDLTYRFDGVLSPESITRAVLDARNDLETPATITEYLPVLVERFAKGLDVWGQGARAHRRLEAGRRVQLPGRDRARPARHRPRLRGRRDLTMGCGDACPVHPGTRYEDWDVADPAGATLDQVRTIREDLQTRVSNLLPGFGI